jgi:hypothetical protein
MTTMNDTQVLGELGWTLQIIYDNTNGLIPLIWRPPYGDVDNRVRAIAREVFGLTTVIWNQCVPIAVGGVQDISDVDAQRHGRLVSQRLGRERLRHRSHRAA